MACCLGPRTRFKPAGTRRSASRHLGFDAADLLIPVTTPLGGIRAEHFPLGFLNWSSMAHERIISRPAMTVALAEFSPTGRPILSTPPCALKICTGIGTSG